MTPLSLGRFFSLAMPVRGEVRPVAAVLCLCLVLFYAGLSTAAMTCFPHADETARHHQHTHTSVSHASLCAWACQVNSSPSVPSSFLSGWIWLFTVGILATRWLRYTLCPSFPVCGRSPPHISAC
jgi:hypothetical protein